MTEPEPAAEAPPEQVDDRELRASLAHDEWANAMRRAGWRYGPELDLPGLTHPKLVPWSQLTQADWTQALLDFDAQEA